MTEQELQRALDALKTRGEIKRLAKEIENNVEMKDAFVALMVRFSHVDPHVATKKQIRMYLDRAEKSQIRSNPIFVDEAFRCGHCQKSVPIGGVMIRDHCPFCLWGRHLDNIPGDRASNCGGLMKPLHFSFAGDTRWIHYSCTQCHHVFRVRSHPDDGLEIL